MNHELFKYLRTAPKTLHLNEIGCTYLMRDFGKVIVPEKVRQEVVEHRPEALEDTGIVWKWISHPSHFH